MDVDLDEIGMGVDSVREPVAARVDRGRDARFMSHPDQAAVAVGVCARRQRSGQRQPPRLGQQRGHNRFELPPLVTGDRVARLVELGQPPRLAVRHRQARAGLAVGPHEPSLDALGGEFLGDPPARVSREQSGDNRPRAERGRHLRDVDALASRERDEVLRAMNVAEVEALHLEQPVDRRVSR